MTFGRPPRPVLHGAVIMTDRRGFLHYVRINSILVTAFLVILAAHGGQTRLGGPLGVSIRDTRGQRPPFIMPRFDVSSLKRLVQSNQVITKELILFNLWLVRSAVDRYLHNWVQQRIPICVGDNSFRGLI